MQSSYTTSGTTLYTDQDSIAGHVLRFLVEEKECPCKIEIVRGDIPQPICEINPGGQYPLLTDKMLALKDYSAIVLYLQERFPAEELLPGHPKIRAQIRSVCAELEAWSTILDAGTYIHECDWVQDRIDDLTYVLTGKNRWFFGNQFTLADVYAAPFLYRVCNSNWKALSLPKLVREYCYRLFNRRSFRNSLGKPIEEEFLVS